MEVESSRGISALLRRDGRASFLYPPWPHDNTGRRQLSVSQEVGSHQELDLLASRSWPSGLWHCKKLMSVVQLPRRWYFVRAAQVY